MLAEITWSFGNIAIAIIIGLTVLGLLYLFLQVTKIPVPGWLWQAIGMVVACVVFIVLIKFVISL